MIIDYNNSALLKVGMKVKIHAKESFCKSYEIGYWTILKFEHSSCHNEIIMHLQHQEGRILYDGVHCLRD